MPGHVIRRGTVEDLDALVWLEEKAFPVDAFNREQLRRLLLRARATIFVLEVGGQVRGSAVMLWRRGAHVGRLYSVAVDPDFQGRGLGAELMGACEQAARERGCRRVSLEVRADNERALGFYHRRDYALAGRLPDYYADGEDGLRLMRELPPEREGGRLEVPYYAQSLEFTCGPACLMMALRHFDASLELDRSLELMLWKEATTIFMTSGLGGCGPFGLALAARRRGRSARVLLSDRQTPFLGSVRSPEKKEVIRLVHAQLREQSLAAGVGEAYYDFAFDDMAQAVRAGEVPIALISTYRLHRVKAPHWVVVTGFDAESVYFHDPYEGFYTGQARDVRIPIEAFNRMRGYGRDLHKSVVFVGSGS